MEKYRFDRKLQEAVLRRNEGQQLTIIIDREENVMPIVTPGKACWD